MITNSKKNIFYSAYLWQRVQFNDIDAKIKEEYKQTKNVNSDNNGNLEIAIELQSDPAKSDNNI